VRNAMIALLCLITTRTAFADGPFGVDVGSPVSALPGCKSAPGDFGAYVCTSLPKSHPDFVRFIVIATPMAGVCKVEAMGSAIADSGSAAETRARIDRIAEQLVTTYGPYSAKIDVLATESIWTKPTEWLMALHRQERDYAYVWLEGEGNYKPVNGVRGIKLEVAAKSPRSATVKIGFEFVNFDACDNEINAKEGNAFSFGLGSLH